jgi:hypothetical protein
MVTLRCTRPLLAKLPLLITEPVLVPSGRLGDWYATLVKYRGPHLVMCTNERTLLTVFVTAAQPATFPIRFRVAVLDLLSLLGIPSDSIAVEAGALATLAIGRTLDRGMLGSMNDLARHATHRLHEHPGITHLDLAAILLEIPRKPLQFRSAEEATRVVLGAV